MTKKSQHLIFIVEDNETYGKALVHFLKTHEYNNVLVFNSGEECLKNIYKKPQIVIQDYNLQGLNGISVMKRALKRLPGTGFVFLSSITQLDVAIETIKAGAFYYIVKNEQAFQRILLQIERIIEQRAINRKNQIRRFWKVIISIVIVLIVCVLLYLYYY